jgi:ferredoxin
VVAETLRGSMRVVVDLAMCQGYAQCAFLAPDSFRLSGPEGLMYDPNPPDDLRDRVLRAVAACPVKAISTDVPGPDGAGGDGASDDGYARASARAAHRHRRGLAAPSTFPSRTTR